MKKLNINIEEINNGYLTQCYRDVYAKKDTVYHSDILDVLKYIDGTHGEIQRQLKKIQKKENNEQS